MEIKEIKSQLTITATLQHYNLKSDKHDMLLCPFHDDKNPSLKIYPGTNTFHCFGCGKNGDVIEFIQLKEASTGSACSKHAAITKASSMLGVNGNPIKKQNINHKPILLKVYSLFKKGLQINSSHKAKAYLQMRNLSHELLDIGYNSGQFHTRGKLKESDIKACLEASLLTPFKGRIPNTTKQGYTAFASNCIIFPLKNNKGEIVSFYGRSILENTSSKPSTAGRHFYLKNRTGLYPHYPNPSTIRIILTEAIIDAATLLQLKEITNNYEILSCYGTNGLTNEHKQALKEWSTYAKASEDKEIIFFFDGDNAGIAAVEKYRNELNELLPNIKISKVETPEGEDINSLVQGHDPEILTHLIENRNSTLPADREKTEGYESERLQTSDLTSDKEDLPSGDDSLPAGQAGLPPMMAGKLDTKNPEYITFTSGEILITILGGINLQQLDRMRLTLKVSRTDTNDPLHSIRHSLDLYHSDYLEKFINKASEQLETGSNILRKALAELIDQVEQYRLSKSESLKEQKPKQRKLTPEQEQKAINYLSSADLMKRTGEDIGKAGVIGEETNRLLMYLVFTSRLRSQPLHVVSLGASGTGKTYLQEKVSELIPQQEKLEITILSENAFYYFERKELQNKLVLIEDMDGAQDVLYPLRELQSKKRISKTIPIKDSKGNLKTVTLQVEGPISLAGTTTKEWLYEDNSNRSLLIYLDGSKEHKEQIMEYQRKLSAGKINSKQEHYLKESFKDMQTVLKPVRVRNPYAEHLKLPEYVFKPLRTNAHYLAVIETITFYHQYQREIKTDQTTGEKYIETTLEDIEWANKLLKDILLAKSDELPRAVREFFETLKRWITKKKKENFYAKEIREMLRIYPMKVNRYINDLENRGFIKKTGGNKKIGYEYEIYRWDDYEMLQAGADVMDKILRSLQLKKYTLPPEKRSIT